MEYNPKWVVVSNDDMYKIDEPEVLARELRNPEIQGKDTIFTFPSLYHSVPVKLAGPRWTYKLYKFFFTSEGRFFLNLYKKFSVSVFLPEIGIVSSVMFKKGVRLIESGPFVIFNTNYVESVRGTAFNEDFINSNEDAYVSLNACLVRKNFALINYKIGDYISSTLSNSLQRKLRHATGDVLLNFLLPT